MKYPERVKDSTKTSTSIMFCGSAAGNMLPAYVVYTAEHIWSTWRWSAKYFVAKQLSSNSCEMFMRHSKVRFRSVWPDVADQGNVDESQSIRCPITPKEGRRGELVFRASQLKIYLK